MKVPVNSTHQIVLWHAPVSTAFYERTEKSSRTFDVVFSTIAILSFLPLLLVLAVAVLVSSSGPAVCTRNRVGLGGKPFSCFKFRTQLKDMEQHANGLVYIKSKADPDLAEVFRVRYEPQTYTCVGRFLRTTGIDELPQLFNVLAGHMSIFGPRVMVAAEFES